MNFEQHWPREEVLNSQHFSNTNVSCPYKGSKLDIAVKVQTSMYNNYFSNFGRPLVLDDLCKDIDPRRPRFWRRKFLKVFTIYRHGGHLGPRTVTILAIFCPPKLRKLHIKFEQNWFSGFKGEVI